MEYETECRHQAYDTPASEPEMRAHFERRQRQADWLLRFFGFR